MAQWINSLCMHRWPVFAVACGVHISYGCTDRMCTFPCAHYICIWIVSIYHIAYYIPTSMRLIHRCIIYIYMYRDKRTERCEADAIVRREKQLPYETNVMEQFYMAQLTCLTCDIRHRDWFWTQWETWMQCCQVCLDESVFIENWIYVRWKFWEARTGSGVLLYTISYINIFSNNSCTLFLDHFWRYTSRKVIEFGTVR